MIRHQKPCRSALLIQRNKIVSRGSTPRPAARQSRALITAQRASCSDLNSDEWGYLTRLLLSIVLSLVFFSLALNVYVVFAGKLPPRSVVILFGCLFGLAQGLFAGLGASDRRAIIFSLVGLACGPFIGETCLFIGSGMQAWWRWFLGHF